MPSLTIEIPEGFELSYLAQFNPAGQSLRGPFSWSITLVPLTRTGPHVHHGIGNTPQEALADALIPKTPSPIRAQVHVRQREILLQDISDFDLS
jgi:hypothetical protein